MIPTATYRVQFHPGFSFEDAAAITDYLAELGISHLYASPYLQAAPGSTHGYDVVDPTKVNEELGGVAGHRHLYQALEAQDLGQILDIVPNHMAITGPENAWWWDVLENGPSSIYASYFDVDWNPSETRLGNKIFLPILGDRYGRVLEAGQIKIVHQKGRFTLHYYEHRFPVALQSLGNLLHQAAEACQSNDLAFAADLLNHLPVLDISEHEHKHRRHRNMKVIRAQLRRLVEENADIRGAVDREIEKINHDPDRLDRFLESQNYQLAYWRGASEEMGYRRFFDINTLVGLRVEDETVFLDTHRLIQKWLQADILDGIRVDHPDGLRDPQRYLERLRGLKPEGWIIAEKILHPGEGLPDTWPVEGTTGYDFMYLVTQVLTDRAGEAPLTDFYDRFTGRSGTYDVVVREKKHQVMQDTLGGDVNHLTELLLDICRRHPRFRDYTRAEVSEVLRELIACFPVYRSYVMPWHEEVRTEDRRNILAAADRAKNALSEDGGDLLGFVQSILLLEHRGEAETEFVLRFQQLTAPVTAKGVEDTAFYCYNRFLALNEVGGNPGTFGISVDQFHQALAERATSHPHGMLSTSTHDTKRSEDVRARLALLSEVPRLWTETVRRWSHRNGPHKVNHWPDRNMEYLLYQTLVGAWPIETERMWAFAEKAAREAKEHTSWSHIDPDYEDGLKRFVNAILADTWFRSDLGRFVRPLVLPGRINALAQVLIKLSAPGVPDIYQGSELWDLSLVDPDNRRPVDFDHRRKLLVELDRLSPEETMERMSEGLPKLWMIRRALALRKRLSAVFHSGTYAPLFAEGAKARHVVSFVRGQEVVTVVPRLLLGFGGQWGDTSITLPPGSWRNELTGDPMPEGKQRLQDLFERFPVALLSRMEK